MKKKLEKYYCIKGVWVEKEIFTRKFCCDLEKCKGACCWVEVGSTGCIATQLEAEKITTHADMMTQHKPIIVKTGEEYFVACDEEERCHLCHTCDDGIVYCKAQNLEEVGVEVSKPVSCGLYPIVTEIIDDQMHLDSSHFWDEYCVGATEKGEKENVTLYDLSREYIKRLLGEDFVAHCDIFYKR